MSGLDAERIDQFLDQLKYDPNGLVTVIVQDAANDELLMVAHANRDAVRLTLETGQAHYYSRSRGQLWLKGETSGHTQAVRELRIDCDGDAILIKVEQTSGACHKGYRSCFFRVLRDGRLVIEGAKVFDPGQVY